MRQQRLAMAFLAIVVLSGCAPQLRPPEGSQALIEEKREQKREVTPTFSYRPGGGLTIAGDP
jgi:hypothetical protein